jgi:flagellar hook-basal body complex protein FliE
MSDPLGLISSPSATPTRPASPRGPQAPGEQGGPSFKDALMKEIEQVNKLQQDAEMAIEDFAAGRRDDVTNVMNAKNQADVAFQMLMQVRNKMMDAYEEVKQIRV